MKFNVVIKDKCLTVHAAEGVQDIQWLCNSAQLRYDDNCGVHLGNPVDVRLKDGSQVSFTTILNTLPDESQVFILYEDDVVADN